MSKANQTPGSKTKTSQDLPDSAADKDKLRSDKSTIDLPDVKDIPGQEFVHPPDLREYSDTTISSDDEEGKGIWDDEQAPGSPNVSRLERKLLDESENDMPTRDDRQLRDAELDSTDEDGTPLNERTTALSGSDLDVPGASDDDEQEDIGEEDEENNPYSLGGDDNSINEERDGI